MKDLIIEQIEKRARIEHDSDLNKVPAEFFGTSDRIAMLYQGKPLRTPEKGTLYYLGL